MISKAQRLSSLCILANTLAQPVWYWPVLPSELLSNTRAEILPLSSLTAVLLGPCPILESQPALCFLFQYMPHVTLKLTLGSED